MDITSRCSAVREYVETVWRCRYFWFSLVRMDLRVRYRRSVLGVGWSLLHPVAMTIVLCTVFHTLMGADIRDFGPYLMSGLAFWGFITASTAQGGRCFYQGEAYIRQYPAPLAIYPLRTVLGAAFHFLIALGAVIALHCALHGPGNLPALVALAPGVALLLVLGWAIAVLAGMANVYFPDTGHMFDIGLQILFYATPVIWPASMMHQRGLGWLVDFNPMASLLELVRRPILHGQIPEIHTYAISLATVFVVFILALTALATLQRRLIFRL